MKRLTERQAWLRLAKLWDDRCTCEKNSCVHVHIGKRKMSVLGLCSCIHVLYLNALISPDVRDAMDGRLRCKGKFRWALDFGGAAARAAFCRKQAERLKPKKQTTKTKQEAD